MREGVRVDYREVRATFARFIASIGGRVANSSLDHGAYQLDRQGGGWAIEKILLSGKGVSRPFGEARYTSTQLVSHMNFAIAANMVRNQIEQDAEDNEERCAWCIENDIENCRHVGM